MNNQKKIKVLIAEDDFLACEEISRILKKRGYEIVGTASNGLDALDMTNSLKPDVVLMDIKMPEADELESAHKMQKLQMEIAKRKQTEKELRETEEKFRTIADYTYDWEYWVSPEGKFNYISPSCERITEYSPDEFLCNPKLLINIVHPDDAAIVENHKCKILETGKSEPVEFRIISKNKKERWISHTCQIVYNKAGANIGIRGSNRDITERKKGELILLKMRRFESIGILAGGIAHDFNNILMGVFGNVSIAKDQLSKEHPSFKHLEAAERSMDKTVRLTKRLLTFAKGGLPIKEDVCIDLIIEDVVRFDLLRSNVIPIFKHTDNLWTAKVDKGQVQQVFSNLTLNANQAMPDGGNLYITLENANVSEGEVSNLKKGKYIKITVRDEGTGIDQKHLSRIFDPYFSTKHIGGGLGLATTFSIINKHNGHISIDSELGKGTSITLFLPASESQFCRKTKQLAVEHSKRANIARVLVMDDNKMLLIVATQMLEKIGYEAEIAYDGKQAIDMYRKAFNAGNKFDIVIMDLRIPNGIGGKEAIKTVLEIDEKARVIVSSGYSDDPVMANHSEYGFKGLLAKPYTMNRLQETLTQVLIS